MRNAIAKRNERGKKMIKTDKVIYRARTQEEYDWLMEKLDDAGCEWGWGERPRKSGEESSWSENYWETYSSDYCIDLEKKLLTCADFDFYDNNLDSDYKDYEYIEVSELMEKEADDFKQGYINWLSENIEQYKVMDNVYRLTLPFLDKHNDMIEIYIQDKKTGKIVVTDNGGAGIELTEARYKFYGSFEEKTMICKRQLLLMRILKLYKVDILSDGSLSISTSRDRLYLDITRFVQCVQVVLWLNEVYFE